MINITFPDGSVRQYESGVSAFDIATSISPRLAADVLAATVVTASDTTGKGMVYDVTRPILEDAAVRLHKRRMLRLNMCSGTLHHTFSLQLLRLFTQE